MTKFEKIGVNYQFDANNIEEANKAFERSCNACCHMGRRAKCKQCAIDCTHTMVVAYFNDKAKEDKNRKYNSNPHI